MLKTRVITALVLLALVLPSLFLLPQAYWAILTAMFIGVGAWEWGGLLGMRESARRVLGASLAALCAVVSLLAPAAMGVGTDGLAAPWVFVVYGVAAVFWCLVVPRWMAKKWPLPRGWAGILVGLVVLFPTWLALVQLRVPGPAILLAILAVVWIADIAAYFSGKAFGKNKLAPAISPGKTWEGAIGAGLGVVLYGSVLRIVYAFEPVAMPLWILCLLAVTAISIVGDLYESLLKRQAGIKDSSNVLPGHGGVLDRIDSLTSTLPVVALLWLLLLKGAGLKRQNVTVLGATGSIGVNTLDVIRRHPDRYRAYALCAHSQVDKLFEQCQEFHPVHAVVRDERLADELALRCRNAGLTTTVSHGVEALVAMATRSEVDTVMAAIVGAAGLEPTLAAARAGKKILLANKEVLVMAGELFMHAVRENNAVLLPVDSEHNAIFQSLPSDFSRGLSICGVRRILLTASGGPFRSTPLAALADVTPEAACAHPNWVMGRKISVDSASMMNKGLEVIEAHWLFACPAEQIQVVVHPQSVIHSLVEYTDGSVLAQLGNPDMRTPIAYALAYPERIDAGVPPLDLFQIARLDFEAPDFERFPCLELAYTALSVGGTAPAILNAANEVAVAAFLDRRLSFAGIPRLIKETLRVLPAGPEGSLADVLMADAEARRVADCFIRESAIA